MAWQCHQGEQRPKAALDHRLPGELGRIINPEDESPTGEPPAQPTIPTVPEVVELSRQFDTDANVDDRRMISSGDYAFDYDGSSNLTKVHGPGEALTFEFNAQRQLTGINGTHTYTYDLWGRRVSSSDSQTQEPLVFAWKDSRVIAIGQRSQGNVRWTHAIGYGPAGPVFMAGLQGNPSYLIATDHLSTPYGWVNAQTGKAYYTPYSPWGEQLFHGTYKVPTPPDEEPTTKSRKTEGGGFNIATQQYVPQPYETADGPVTPFEPPPDPLFGIAPLDLVGHFLDRSTGLIYMHHRYFSPRLGHFLTPDFRAPDIYEPTTVTEPYAYAAGNPVIFWDPDGLDRTIRSVYDNGQGTRIEIVQHLPSEPKPFGFTLAAANKELAPLANVVRATIDETVNMVDISSDAITSKEAQAFAIGVAKGGAVAAVVLLLPEAIVIYGGGAIIATIAVSSAIDRYENGQTGIQIYSGSVLGATGLNQVWAAVANEDFPTMRSLNLSDNQRLEIAGEFVGSGAVGARFFNKPYSTIKLDEVSLENQHKQVKRPFINFQELPKALALKWKANYDRDRLVKVVSWASEGVPPDLQSGRWVMIGGPTRLNFFFSGLPEPKVYGIKNYPFFRYESSNVPFSNFIVGEIPESQLAWPGGWEKVLLDKE